MNGKSYENTKFHQQMNKTKTFASRNTILFIKVSTQTQMPQQRGRTSASNMSQKSIEDIEGGPVIGLALNMAVWRFVFFHCIWQNLFS